MAKPNTTAAGDAAAVYVSLDDLHPWEGNPRKNDAAVPKVVESIRRFGFAAPIIADRDGMILAGHTRYRAAREIGLDVVPVRYVDLDPTAARLYALADNRLGEVADWDEARLAQVIREIALEEEVDPSFFVVAGFTVDEVEGMLEEDILLPTGDPISDPTENVLGVVVEVTIPPDLGDEVVALIRSTLEPFRSKGVEVNVS